MSLAISRAIVRNKELKKESFAFSRLDFLGRPGLRFCSVFSVADRSFSASFLPAALCLFFSLEVCSAVFPALVTVLPVFLAAHSSADVTFPLVYSDGDCSPMSLSLAFAMVWDFSLLSSMAVRISSLGILEAGFLVFGFVVTSLVLISFISHLQSRLVPLLRFARLGRHQAVQFCISWIRIIKRHQISGTADQTMAGTHIGDVG